MKSKEHAFDELISNIQLNIGSDISGSGFHAIFCPICGNKGVKKGGFKFESDKIIYNCFRGRCDATTVYETGAPVPNKFKDLMKALGVEIPIELSLSDENTKVRLFRDALDEDRFVENHYRSMDFPESLVPLEGSKGEDTYMPMLFRRCVLPFDFFYAHTGKYAGCMAIPIRFGGKLIGIEYYTKKGMYITETCNPNTIFTRDKFLQTPVILVEGIMDALCFPNTVAVKKSKVSPEQAYHLRKHDVVVLPDRKNSKLYESAVEFGWKVCVPGWDEKDLNEYVMNKGLFNAARLIKENTYEIGTKSEILYKHWITKGKK